MRQWRLIQNCATTHQDVNSQADLLHRNGGATLCGVLLIHYLYPGIIIPLYVAQNGIISAEYEGVKNGRGGAKCSRYSG